MSNVMSVQVPDRHHADLASESFRILSDTTRVRVLWVLMQGECNVGTLAELVDVSQTVASQHLAKLRAAGLVTSRREGTYVYYSATNSYLSDLLADALTYVQTQESAAVTAS